MSSKDDIQPPPSEYYFSAHPTTPDIRRTITVELLGTHHRLVTSAGIFSPERLDKGTEVLLNYVPDPPSTGNFLDIGCGWGPIALSLGLHSPQATIWAIDVNERSLTLTAENARLLGLSNITCSLPEKIDPTLRFDTIWANPPIRIGKENLHALLLTWLPQLSVGGTAWLVVQRNLGSDSLHRWLSTTLGAHYSVTRAHTSKGYRVLSIERLSVSSD